MKRVVIESPFKGETDVEQVSNVMYARACMLDSLRRGEAPFASHLLYTQVLDDALAAERELGIAAGLAFVRDADLTAVYINRDVSSGMIRGVEAAGFADRPYDVRVLGASEWGQGKLDAERSCLEAWKKGYKARALDDSIIHRDGWKCAAMHDPSGRRGIWYRQERGNVLVVQGGREGEFEAKVVLDRNEHSLLTILDTSRWMIDDHGTRKGADVLAESVEP